MSEKLTFVLAHATARERAVAAVERAPDGWVVEIKPKTRTLEQNALLHALCAAVSRQRQWAGRWIDTVGWKRLFVDAFLRETTGTGMTVSPSLDMTGVVSVGEPTHAMSKQQLIDLIDWITAWCRENEIETGERMEEPAW